MAKGESLYARLECEFVRSFEFLSLPLGARMLYLALWCYCLEKRRARVARPDNNYLATLAGLSRHPIATYLQRLHDAGLLDVQTSSIECLGIREKHKQFQWKDDPNQKQSSSNIPPIVPLGTEPNRTEPNGTPPTPHNWGEAVDILHGLGFDDKDIAEAKRKPEHHMIRALELTLEKKPKCYSAYFMKLIRKNTLPPSEAEAARDAATTAAERERAQEERAKAKAVADAAAELAESKAFDARVAKAEQALAAMTPDDQAEVARIRETIPGHDVCEGQALSRTVLAVEQFMEGKNGT